MEIEERCTLFVLLVVIDVGGQIYVPLINCHLGHNRTTLRDDNNSRFCVHQIHLNHHLIANRLNCHHLMCKLFYCLDNIDLARNVPIH